MTTAMTDTDTASERDLMYAEAARLSHTTTTAMIGRCTVKGCGSVIRADVVTHISYSPIRVSGGTAWDLGRTVTYDGPANHCGHGWDKWSVINGTLTDRKCDARCVNAKRADCECSCAGANHGTGWS